MDSVELDERVVLEDLGDLIISDDELYLDEMNAGFTERERGSTEALNCPNCDKTYKRKAFYERHVATCDGKRKRVPCKQRDDSKCKCFFPFTGRSGRILIPSTVIRCMC